MMSSFPRPLKTTAVNSSSRRPVVPPRLRALPKSEGVSLIARVHRSPTEEIDNPIVSRR